MYYDTVNDTSARSHAGFGDTGLYYTDNSTVDDLCEAQMAVPPTAVGSSNQSLWAARVATCVAFDRHYSNATHPPPMTLFLLIAPPPAAAAAAPAPPVTTMGYHWKLNVTESTLYAASVNATGGASWRAAYGNITLLWDDSQLVALLPMAVLGGGSGGGSGAMMDFKWWSGKEWEVELSEPMDFMVYGDAAPNARFNYRYEVGQQSVEHHKQEHEGAADRMGGVHEE